MRYPGHVILGLLAAAVVLLIVVQRSTRETQVRVERITENNELAENDYMKVRVIDGDTIVIADERIRLFGIDAPESDQTCSEHDRLVRCGDEATQYLRNLIGNQKVSCKGQKRDRYSRLVAVCSVDGNDIGRQMVIAGWAVAFRAYSDQYVPDENVARLAGRGLWRGQFQLPSEWRAEQ